MSDAASFAARMRARRGAPEPKERISALTKWMIGVAHQLNTLAAQRNVVAPGRAAHAMIHRFVNMLTGLGMPLPEDVELGTRGYIYLVWSTSNDESTLSMGVDAMGDWSWMVNTAANPVTWPEDVAELSAAGLIDRAQLIVSEWKADQGG